ncbi:hypothetical protein LTR08_005386 [Meristemomyces frigidus]|nr:hypothetical protein LTR08_005386 [Meristemomyces frigidus]
MASGTNVQPNYELPEAQPTHWPAENFNRQSSIQPQATPRSGYPIYSGERAGNVQPSSISAGSRFGDLTASFAGEPSFAHYMHGHAVDHPFPHNTDFQLPPHTACDTYQDGQHSHSYFAQPSRLHHDSGRASLQTGVSYGQPAKPLAKPQAGLNTNHTAPEDAYGYLPQSQRALTYGNGLGPRQPKTTPRELLGGKVMIVSAQQQFQQAKQYLNESGEGVENNSGDESKEQGEQGNESEIEDDPASIADDTGHRFDLKFNSIAEAKENAHAREPLMATDDDWRLVKRSRLRQKQWVVRIKAAFHHAYTTQPTARLSGIAYTAGELAEWTRWQDVHDSIVVGILNDEDIQHEDEQTAWKVLEMVLETHHLGIRPTGYRLDKKATFSDRMVKIERAIADLTIVRCSVIGEDSDDSLRHLVANPENFAKRKVTNLWVNFRKALRERERKRLVGEKAKTDAEARGETLLDSDGDTENRRGSRKDGLPSAALKRKKAHMRKGKAASNTSEVRIEDNNATLGGSEYSASDASEHEKAEMLADPASKDILYRGLSGQDESRGDYANANDGDDEELDDEEDEGGEEDDQESDLDTDDTASLSEYMVVVAEEDAGEIEDSDVEVDWATTQRLRRGRQRRKPDMLESRA